MKRAPKKKNVELLNHPREPEYMVQVSEPRMLRKDILEALREVIIFMQGYEKFRKIQEEKVVTFTRLKAEVKELQLLLDQKLRKYVPKGKLHPIRPGKHLAEEPQEEREEKKPVLAKEVDDTRPEPVHELDRLEAQLRDIEGQLNSMGQ